MATNSELIFWLVLLVGAAAALLVTSLSNQTNSVDDLNAWKRNYSRLQNRY